MAPCPESTFVDSSHAGEDEESAFMTGGTVDQAEIGVSPALGGTTSVNA